MHVAQILAVLGGERRHMLRDLLHHAGIGVYRDVAAAEMLGERHDAERDRHPGLDPRRCVLLGGIALDPHQFGRAAADVEQDGAPSPGVEQRRAADHGQRRLGLAIDNFELNAGFLRDAGAKMELDALGKRTVGVFEAMLQARHRYGPDAVGYYVVSGTQGADDVLAPLLIARWAEAYDRVSGEVAVDIAPMFESVEALEHCGNTLRTLLGDPLYRRHLDARGRTQCALIGYSDANKEGGICASRYAAYRAQADISAALAAANERHVIFHARGGSIARGGGRVDSLVRTAPPGTVSGSTRTVGEVSPIRCVSNVVAWRAK